MLGNARGVHFMNVMHVKTDIIECNNTFFKKMYWNQNITKLI